MSAFLAAQQHAEPDPHLKTARSFWIASLIVRGNIRDGSFELADQQMNEMAEMGHRLIGCSGFARNLGAHMLRTVSELSLEYMATRARMADDLSRASN